MAAAWLLAIIVGVLRGQAWTRAASIVWQVLQFAVGLGALILLTPATRYGYLVYPLVLLGAYLAFRVAEEPAAAVPTAPPAQQPVTSSWIGQPCREPGGASCRRRGVYV